jgi:hypothetical protein
MSAVVITAIVLTVWLMLTAATACRSVNGVGRLAGLECHP